MSNQLFRFFDFMGVDGGHRDPWVIKKTLEKSDVDGLSRLVIRKNMVRDHIIPYLDEESLATVENGEKILVMISDMDTYTDHRVSFTKWTSSRMYNFQGGWSSEFVRRRELKRGDQIAMYWDENSAMFHFKVEKRAQYAYEIPKGLSLELSL